MTQNKSPLRLGYWLTVISIVLGICYAGLAVYWFAISQDSPVATTALHTGILLLTPLMILQWAVIHYTVPPEKRIFTLASLAFLSILSVLTSINRYNALTVVAQATAMGRMDGLEWFQPYEAPSIMLSMEVLGWGYFFGLTCLCLAPVFARDRRERAIFWTLVVIGSMGLVSTLSLVLDEFWLSIVGVLAWGPGSIILHVFLARWFRRRARAGQ